MPSIRIYKFSGSLHLSIFSKVYLCFYTFYQNSRLVDAPVILCQSKNSCYTLKLIYKDDIACKHASMLKPYKSIMKIYEMRKSKPNYQYSATCKCIMPRPTCNNLLSSFSFVLFATCPNSRRGGTNLTINIILIHCCKPL